MRRHPAHVWALLGYRLGWSMQRPVRRAATAQVDAIAATPESVWIAAGGLVMRVDPVTRGRSWFQSLRRAGRRWWS